MAKLVVLTNRMKGRTFDLSEDRITVGRFPGNAICLEDSTISGQHAEFSLEGDTYLLRDLGTTNGTCVNGRRITTTHLCHGDKILFGQLELEYLASAKGGNRPAPPSRLINLSDTSPSAIPLMSASYPPIPAGSKQRKFKTLLKVSLVLFGLVVILLLTVVIIKIVNSP